MKHLIATGITAAFLGSTTLAAAQDMGAKDYQDRCARCHDTAKAVSFMKKHPDAKDRAAWLEKKLSRHHARNPEQRARIIAYMETLLAGAK